ncbi:MAG: hypothetical protein ACT4QF_02440 [Sporichthyaceae bacterium]
MNSWCCGAGRAAALVALFVGAAGCGGEQAPQRSVEPAREVVAEPMSPARDAAASSAAQGAAAAGVTLEADLYSGRANPSWALTDEESYGFQALLDMLPVGRCSRPARDGLGFRGFGVSGLKAGRVAVDSDCVRLEGADGARSERLDSRRLAHRYLADLAAHHDPALRQLLAKG